MMNSEDAIRIRRQVRRSDRAVELDKQAFESYQNGDISIERCIEMFRANNAINGKIPREFMLEYLRLLGWRLRKADE